MKKIAQSLLDFINVFPLQSIQIVHRSPISDKEAKALFNVWRSDKDSYGYHIVPSEIDPMMVASLTTKGMVKSKPLSRVGSDGLLTRTLEITDKGRTIIRNIILHAEKSAFEDSNDFDFQYEFIHRASMEQKKKDGKVAFSQNRLSHLFHQNWVQRAFRYGTDT